MNTTYLWLIIVVIIGAIALLFVYGGSNVPITSDYGTKIVYTTDLTTATSSLIAHCERQGGTFNECGTTCEPGAAVCAQVCAYTCENIPENGNEGIDTADWETFNNDEYGFSLEYPADDWNMETDISSPSSPKYNFYMKPAGVPVDLPLDHFADITNVSVFPEGIPTEGVFGQTEDFDLDTNFEVTNDSRIFVLEDGAPFAAFIKPTDPPQSWGDAGFIWLRARINNLETRCERDGEVISAEECDPLIEDDEIIRNGTVNENDWNTGVAILESITFTGTSTGDLINVINPMPNEVVDSPLVVTGEARGTWYFEGVFSLVLTNWDGEIIGEVNAEAQESWMTEDFVPFEATITFDSPYSAGDPEFMQNGALILQKANPSGLPENADALEIPVMFNPA